MTTPPTEAAPTESPSGVPWRSRNWRWATPAVVAACGALFVVSAVNSHGTDLRPGRYIGVTGLVASEKIQVDALQHRAALLQSDIDALTNAVPDADVRAAQALKDRAMPAAGLAKVSGPGLSITMADAPAEIVNTTKHDPNLLVVHQQDIQAVVNALWAGGATALTIQGQRIISTTGIKCSGSAVLLGGVLYPGPFVIQAVGDPTRLTAALDSNDRVVIYREYAAAKDYQLGWSMHTTTVNAPAYAGITSLTYATPATP